MEMVSNFISLFHRLLKALQYQGPHRCSRRQHITSWIFQQRILLQLRPATLQFCHWKMISSHLDSDIIINIPLLIIFNCLFDFFFSCNLFQATQNPFKYLCIQMALKAVRLLLKPTIEDFASIMFNNHATHLLDRMRIIRILYFFDFLKENNPSQCFEWCETAILWEIYYVTI